MVLIVGDFTKVKFMQRENDTRKFHDSNEANFCAVITGFRESKLKLIVIVAFVREILSEKKLPKMYLFLVTY